MHKGYPAAARGKWRGDVQIYYRGIFSSILFLPPPSLPFSPPTLIVNNNTIESPLFSFLVFIACSIPDHQSSNSLLCRNPKPVYAGAFSVCNCTSSPHTPHTPPWFRGGFETPSRLRMPSAGIAPTEGPCLTLILKGGNNGGGVLFPLKGGIYLIRNENVIFCCSLYGCDANSRAGIERRLVQNAVNPEGRGKLTQCSLEFSSPTRWLFYLFILYMPNYISLDGLETVEAN